MIDPDHAKRVLEHQEKQELTPVEILARHYSKSTNPSPRQISDASEACEKLVWHGYTIVRVKDHED